MNTERDDDILWITAIAMINAEWEEWTKTYKGERLEYDMMEEEVTDGEEIVYSQEA